MVVIKTEVERVSDEYRALLPLQGKPPLSHPRTEIPGNDIFGKEYFLPQIPSPGQRCVELIDKQGSQEDTSVNSPTTRECKMLFLASVAAEAPLTPQFPRFVLNGNCAVSEFRNIQLHVDSSCLTDKR